MVKKILLLLVLISVSLFVYAYNPPIMGENLYNLTSPSMLSGEASVAGGSLFYVSPEHMGINPALPASEQRVVINGAYTGLFGVNKDKNYGQAFYAGTMFPTKFGVLSGAVQGVFSDFADMDLGDTFTIRGAFSKDFYEDFYVGFGLAGGFGTDYAVFADVGILYLPGTIEWLSFMKDIRLGVSFTQLGKTFNPDSIGVKGNDSTSGIPSMFTPRFGFAGTLFDIKNIKAGISLDLAIPTFQNILFDTNLQCKLFDIVTISSGWQFNLVETMKNKASYIPSVSVSFKFDIDKKSTSDSTYNMGNHNEITVASAFKSLSNDVTVVSAGGGIHFGVIDTVAPEIILWEE